VSRVRLETKFLRLKTLVTSLEPIARLIREHLDELAQFRRSGARRASRRLARCSELLPGIKVTHVSRRTHVFAWTRARSA
jgi:hypothetical protein